MGPTVESIDGGTGFRGGGAGEQGRAIRTLVSAFEDDPVERWLYPEEAQYRRHFPAFIAAFGGAAFRDQTVWRLGDFDAVAFWFGPGREPDGEAVVQVLVETTSDDLHADSFATLEQMAEGHPRCRTGTCRGSVSIASFMGVALGRI